MTGQVDVKAFWPEWEIEKRIGSGSYGTVYRARKEVGETTVYSAIKVISLPFADSEVESMVAEGLTLNDSVSYYKQLTKDIIKEVSFMESCKGCNNIVRVEDYKVVDGDIVPHCDIFIRMELLTPLNTYLCDRTLSEEEVIKLGIDLCNALIVCEKRNIIHRDIKPENIFVDVFGDFKLGDFGIARSLESMTFGFSQKGTFNYMAPEVFNSSFYDSRADIYSLGIVLYRLLNHNRLPFLDSEKQLLSPSERRLAVERRLKGDKIPTISGVSPELSEVIIKACSHKPEDRYNSANMMKSSLDSVKLLSEAPDELINAEKVTGFDSKRGKKTIFLLLASMIFWQLMLIGLGIYALKSGYLTGNRIDTVSTDSSETSKEDMEERYAVALDYFNQGEYASAATKFYALKNYKDSKFYYRQAADYEKAVECESQRNYADAAEYMRNCTMISGSSERADDYELLDSIYYICKQGNFEDVALLFDDMKGFSPREKRYFSNLFALESAITLMKNKEYAQAAQNLAWAVNDSQWVSEKLGQEYLENWNGDSPTVIGDKSFYSHSSTMHRNLGEDKSGTLYAYNQDNFLDTIAYYMFKVVERDEKKIIRTTYTIYMEPDGTLLDSYLEGK